MISSKIKIARITKLFLLFFMLSNFFKVFPTLTFSNKEAFISLFNNTSFRLTNKNSIVGYKEQAIIKEEQAENSFLGSNQIWSASSDTLAPEETFELINDLIIQDGQTLQFSANAVIDGKGCDIILGRYSQLLVDGGVTVTFKNTTIKNTLNTISCPPIRCMDWYSQACFDNVRFAFNNDWAFRNGQFFIHNDVEFTGTSKFSYHSVRPSYIAQHSNLIFDPQTTFEFYPSTNENNLIKMQDKTSAIIFDGSTLQTTHTGIRLTKGSIYFDNKVTLSSADTTSFLNLIQKDTKDFGSYAWPTNWSPDGRYLAVGGDNGTTDLIVYEWNGSILNQKDTKDFGAYALSVNWSPDGKYLAVGGSYNYNDVIIYQWDGTSLTVTASKSFGSYAYSVNWSPDGKYLAVGGENSSTDLIVYEWDGSILTQKDAKDFGTYAYSVNWSPDGKYLAVGSIDVIIYEWNGSILTQKDKKISVFANSVNWSPDGRYLAAGGYSFVDAPLIVYEWDGLTLTPKGTEGSYRDNHSVNWSPDSKYLAVGGNNGSSDLIVYGVNYSFDTSPQGFINGIIFGNSALGSDYDLDINVLSDANVNIFGKVWYDDVN